MEIPSDILKLVASYFVKPKTKFDTNRIDKPDCDLSSIISDIIHLLEANPINFKWCTIPQNHNAIHL